METITIEQGRRQRPGVKHLTKHNLKVDMTPMVDLGFLLISFFVVTTELSRPRTMNLYMPHDGKPMPSAESKTITILAGGNNRLFYYFGEENAAGIKNPIMPLSWDEKTGIGKIISEKQLQLDHSKGGRNELMVIIKPGKESAYKNLVNLLDEMLIHQVSGYAIIKPGKRDALYLESHKYY
ncbi:MAG: biopolymer transporter ExbD [Sphingobacteriales bacterium]|nr:biopolymer transporter ExbD [Sphingobacteriales bacterium]